jgi:hypothetical protein
MASRTQGSRSVRNVAWNRFTTFDSPTVKQISMICSVPKWAASAP